jgi:hypothetical protein
MQNGIEPRRERSGHDHAQTLRRLAYILDELVRIPGTNIRVGLDALLGLLPAGGDIAGGVMSAYTLVAAHRLGAGPLVISRMAVNIVIDTLVGAVPLLGDLFDAGWKSNKKNIELLDQYLADPAPVKRSSGAVVAIVIAVLIAFIVGTAVLSWKLLRWILAQF